jgi:hypothetical protein
VLLNHPEGVAYIVRSGEPVKLADFGAGSILRPALEKPVVARPAPAAAEGPRPQATGQIYTTASLGTDERGMPISSVVAVDPESGVDRSDRLRAVGLDHVQVIVNQFDGLPATRPDTK